MVPRAIAHIPVQVGVRHFVASVISPHLLQLRFALSSCGSWWLVDGLFDHTQIYKNIVNWFEDIKDLEDRKFVDNLWWWWNR